MESQSWRFISSGLKLLWVPIHGMAIPPAGLVGGSGAGSSTRFVEAWATSSAILSKQASTNAALGSTISYFPVPTSLYRIALIFVNRLSCDNTGDCFPPWFQTSTFVYQASESPKGFRLRLLRWGPLHSKCLELIRGMARCQCACVYFRLCVI
jgi:hypothetical protein